MIPLNFYRDDEYVYYNNPNGITKKMTIADFEAAMSGSGGGGASDWKNNYDLIIDVDASNETPNPVLIKGDYDSLFNMCVNKIPIRVAVYRSDPWDADGVNYPWYEMYQILETTFMVEEADDPLRVTVMRWNGNANKNVAVSSNGTSVSGRVSGMIPSYAEILTIKLNSDNSLTYNFK